MEFKIDEIGFYYFKINDFRKLNSAFGGDYITCYLWLNADEDSLFVIDDH